MDTSTTLLCQTSTGQEDDWKNLYESAFPADERMAVEEIRQLLSKNAMLLHKTYNKANELLCFSLTFPASNFVLLSYIATDSTKRSGGVGSKHMKRLIELMKGQYASHLGLFLEIESTKEQGLDAEVQKARQRRLAFYQRLGAKRLCKNYLMPNMVAGGTPRQGELLWVEFGTQPVDDKVLPGVIQEIYEKAYNLKATDPIAQQVLGQFAGNSTGSICPTPPATPPAATVTPSAPPAPVPVAPPAVTESPAVTPAPEAPPATPVPKAEVAPATPAEQSKPDAASPAPEPAKPTQEGS